MAPELALGGLQAWMQSVIVHPGSLAEALAAAQALSLVAPARVGEVLLPSATLAAEARLGVYHEMYQLRMTEALASNYPALAQFLGGRRFTALVRDYLLAHPSRSYSLNHLSRALPDWLGTAAPLPRRGFCRDLARLEWAISEAFDADEASRLAPEALAAVPAEAWSGARLLPSAALRLVELRWNANEWLESTKDNRHDHPRPRRRHAAVVVFRQRYAVYRRELSHSAFRLLKDLAAGRRIGEAIAAALERRAAPRPEAITGWFRDWAADGLFSGLALEPAHGR
jgi:hypothetical protein